MQHHLMLLTLDGELCLCPKVRGANRVLDMGTGTGIWAIDYAEQHPAAEVSPSPPFRCFAPVLKTRAIDNNTGHWCRSEPDAARVVRA